MSESETQQRTIFGDTLEEQAYIKTTGRVIRPFRRMIDQVVSEFKLTIDDTGLHVCPVDKHNVQMLRCKLYADALDALEVREQLTIGVGSQTFGSALQHARYGTSTDDPITLSTDGERIETETTRQIGATEATINERVTLLDPDSVRQEPDLPDLDFGTSVDLAPETLIEVLRVLETDTKDHIKIGADTDAVIFAQESDLTQRNIRLDATPEDVTEWSIFSGDYMDNLRNIIHNGYIDDLTLKWGSDFPLYAEFEREGVYEGTVMIAPRVKSDSDL